MSNGDPTGWGRESPVSRKIESGDTGPSEGHAPFPPGSVGGRKGGLSRLEWARSRSEITM